MQVQSSLPFNPQGLESNENECAFSSHNIGIDFFLKKDR